MSLGFSATDGYNKTISIAEATQENVIVAYEFNGSPLPETLRLVLPDANGEFWVAMINHIRISTNSASNNFSGSGVNLPTVIPQSPKPSSTQSPTPLASPSPNPSPTSPINPTSTPFQQPSAPQNTQNSETTTEMIAIASIGAISIVGVGLLVYFKKRKH